MRNLKKTLCFHERATQRATQRATSVQRACNERAARATIENSLLFFERVRIAQCGIVDALLRSSWQMFVLHRELENKTPSPWRAEL